MDVTRNAAPPWTFESSRAVYRRDEEEYETLPRWLWSKLHADLALTDSIAGRLARRAASKVEGGQ